MVSTIILPRLIIWRKRLMRESLLNMREFLFGFGRFILL
jgi:hypothetical protein